jgi:hypothetical protein
VNDKRRLQHLGINLSKVLNTEKKIQLVIPNKIVVYIKPYIRHLTVNYMYVFTKLWHQTTTPTTTLKLSHLPIINIAILSHTINNIEYVRTNQPTLTYEQQMRQHIMYTFGYSKLNIELYNHLSFYIFEKQKF